MKDSGSEAQGSGIRAKGRRTGVSGRPSRQSERTSCVRTEVKGGGDESPFNRWGNI